MPRSKGTRIILSGCPIDYPTLRKQVSRQGTRTGSARHQTFTSLGAEIMRHPMPKSCSTSSCSTDAFEVCLMFYTLELSLALIASGWVLLRDWAVTRRVQRTPFMRGAEQHVGSQNGFQDILRGDQLLCNYFGFLTYYSLYINVLLPYYSYIYSI